MFRSLTVRLQFLCLAEISGPGSHILSIWQVPLRRTPHEPQTVTCNRIDASRTAFSRRHPGPATDGPDHADDSPDNRDYTHKPRAVYAWNDSGDAARDGSRTDAANYTRYNQPWKFDNNAR